MDTGAVIASTASADLAAALHVGLVERGGLTDAWVSDVLRTCHWEDEAPLSGSPLATIFSYDDEDPHGIGLTTQLPQPHPERGLDLVPPRFRDVARRVIRDYGRARDTDVQFAFGAELLADGLRPVSHRAYVGVLDVRREAALLELARSTGFWATRYDDHALAICSLLRSSADVMGLGVRDDGAHVAYFAPRAGVPTDLVIQIVEAVLPDWLHGDRDELVLRALSTVALGTTPSGAPAFIKVESPSTELPQRLAPLDAAVAGMPLSVAPHTQAWRARRGRALTSGQYVCVQPQEQPQPGIGPVRGRRSSLGGLKQTVSSAIELGIDALILAQHADGHWEDFDVPPLGASTGWLSAFVLWRAGDLMRAVSPECAERAVAYVDRCPPAYSSGSPADADSIAHTILALEPRRPDATIGLAGELARFGDREGRFGTFLGSPSIGPHPWSEPHADVTPLALHALIACRVPSVSARARDHAEACLRSPGLDLSAFWWSLRWYTAAAWARLGSRIGIPYRGAPDVLEPLGLADSAYRLEHELLAGKEPNHQTLADLSGRQSDDGTWPGSAEMRVRFSSTHEVRSVDRGVYTTALVLSVLDRARARL